MAMSVKSYTINPYLQTRGYSNCFFSTKIATADSTCDNCYSIGITTYGWLDNTPNYSQHKDPSLDQRSPRMSDSPVKITKVLSSTDAS